MNAKEALEKIKDGYGPNHGSKYCYDIALEALYLTSPSPAAGIIEREIAAQSTLVRIRKLRDGYVNQAKFADVDQASYFREFVRRLVDAVNPKLSTSQWNGQALRRNTTPPDYGAKLIDPIDSRGLKGARKQAAENCASMMPNASAEARLRRAILDVLNSVAPAAENLTCNQEQADMDGCMVKVSRQALDEVLAAVNEAAIQAATSSWPATGGEAKKSEGGVKFVKGYFTDQYAAGERPPKPGPSDPTADRREIVARIIDPAAFDISPAIYGLKTQEELEKKTQVGACRRIARDTADKILATLNNK